MGEALPETYGEVGPGKDKGRRFGVLLHPTSLPGKYGAGDLGGEARAFVDWLSDTGAAVWQVSRVRRPLAAARGAFRGGRKGTHALAHTQILPLAPPERQFWSPYSAEDANCGHTLLISLEGLAADGLLPAGDLPAPVPFKAQAEFAEVASIKEPLLRRAARALLDGAGGAGLGEEFAAFLETQAFWLEDAALFAALAGHNAGAWWDWTEALRDREPAAMKAAAAEYAREVAEFKALQFLFNRQWMQVKQYANSKGISIVGDMVSACSRRAGRSRGLTQPKPIYVGGHSADVWANRDLFEVDSEGRPAYVSGVPPDAFSETGQLWGTPLYSWPKHAQGKFAWWAARLQRAFELHDVVRIDHFRAFAGFWAVAATEETAMRGEWRQGPGLKMVSACGRRRRRAGRSGGLTKKNSSRPCRSGSRSPRP